jgi:ABC-type sugar transport system permease subunit
VKSAGSFPRWAPWFFIAPFLLSACTFIVWPVGQSLVLSFQRTFGPEFTSNVGFGNFQLLFSDPLFWRALGNTTLYVSGVVLLQLPIALALAMLLSHPQVRGRTVFRLIFFAPYVVGVAFGSMIFALLFEKRTGLLNVTLHAIFPAFDPDFGWLQNHVMLSLMLASLWLHVGYSMVYFMAAVQHVPRELLEASGIDGANAWQRFRHIILPEIRPVMHFVTIVSIVTGFQVFDLPWLLLKNSAGPENSGLTLVVYLYQRGFVHGDLGYASAIGWAMSLLLIGISLVFRRSLKREELNS